MTELELLVLIVWMIVGSFFIVVLWGLIIELFESAKKLLGFPSQNDETKNCYRCNRDLPLRKFKITNNKHILKMPSSKGRCFCCIECISKLE